MIKLKNLEIGYNNHSVVKNLNWIFPENQISIIKGPNGSGKTTLLKTICGIKKAMHGSVEYHEMFSSCESSYLPQMNKTNFDFPIRVFDFVSMGLLGKSLFFKIDRQRVSKILSELGLDEHKNKYINELSGGLYQRCLFGRMILEDSRILLLDEPFNFLDESNKFFLSNLIKRLAKDKTILMVLHDIEDMAIFNANIYDLKEFRTI
ncbi:MAG: ATP-binding cassette domain-containing protein [Bacteriovoracaceae bacterium]|nr:ATP-binding cassette domain-containing protein [Bacteriovoracaceae bacterium]